MAPARRRVSYIIPPPSEPVPRLQLPPHGASKTGSSAPLLIPFRSHHAHDGSEDTTYTHPAESWPRGTTHPRHRLGVCALALDTATPLVGRSAPEGILYTGARDGLVLSWDLGIGMRRRERRYGAASERMHRKVGRWEIMTGWADEDDLAEDDEDEEVRSDGDVLGEVSGSISRRRRRRTKAEDDIPWEGQWETDLGVFQPGQVRAALFVS